MLNVNNPIAIEHAADKAQEAPALSLVRMLTYRRPAFSRTERRFIKRWIRPLGVQIDAYGNLYKRIGDSNVMWSCHTDSVHRDGGFQKVVLRDGVLKLGHRETQSNCLGADDAAGVWLMREMILAGKPGLYIFHRNEERGGKGSDHIADNERDILKGIEIAIALDRKGMSSVITHQMGRCCSNHFAECLADLLGGSYRCDATGVFTDTANYTSIIPECTNLSVGYMNEHSKAETLSLRFILWLRDRLLALDTTQLPVRRDPSEPSYDGGWSRYYGGAYAEHNYYPTRTYYDLSKEPQPVSKYTGYQIHAVREPELELGPDQDDNKPMTMIELLHEFPDECADYLEEHLGVNTEDLSEYIKQALGLDK